MNRGCLAMLGFLGGAVAGWAACLLVYIMATSLFGYHDFEGAAAMGTAFMIGPVVGLLTGIAAAVWLGRRRGNG
jgi:hypothetical protein